MADQVAALAVQLELQNKQFISAIGQATKRLDQINTSARKSSKGIQSLEQGFRKVQNAALALAGAFASFKGLENFATAADDMANLEGSFRALLGSGERATDMMGRLDLIVKNTGASFQDAKEGVQRLALGLGELGASNNEIQTITENFIKLGRISGASMNDVSGAMVQLSQGLASGVLQGDELKSLLERVPAVTQIIAKDLKVSVGELRKMGSEGKLTAQVVSGALLRATEEVNEQYKLLPETVAQANNRMRAEWYKLSAELGKALKFDEMFIGLYMAMGDATNAVRKFFKNLSTASNDIQGFVKNNELAQAAVATLAVALSVKLIPAMAAFTKAAIALAASNPFTAIITAASIGVVAIIQNWEELGNYLSNKVPYYLLSLKGYWFEMLQAITEKVGSWTQNIKKMYYDVLDSLILGLNVAIEKLNSLPGVAIDSIEPMKREISRMSEYAKKFGEDATEAFNAANESMMDYQQGLSDIAENAKEAAEGAGKLSEAMGNMGGIDFDNINKLDDALIKSAEAIKASVDPYAAFEQQMAKLNELLNAGALEWEHYSAAVFKAQDALDEAVKKMDDTVKEIDVLELGITTLGDSFEKNFSASLSGAQSWSTGMKKVMADVVAAIMKAYLTQKLLGYFGLGGGGTTTQAHGGAWMNGVQMFAQGGVVNAPTFFGTRSGLGLMGEAGPEAILPLKRGAGGDLGVEANINVNVHNNVGADVAVEQNGKDIDIIINRVSSDILKGGNRLAKSLETAYGVNRANGSAY